MGEYLIHTDAGQTLYLEHHGIKGQKWGTRRFQNPDGSLTDEGRVRYGLTDKKLSSSSTKKIGKAYARALNRMDKERAKTQYAYKSTKDKYDRYSNKENKRLARGKSLTDKQKEKQEKYKNQLEEIDVAYDTGINAMKKILQDSADSGVAINARSTVRDCTPAAVKAANAVNILLYSMSDSPTVAVNFAMKTKGQKYKFNSKAYDKDGNVDSRQINKMNTGYQKWLDEAKRNGIDTNTLAMIRF